MDLVLDIGNFRLKGAFFEGDQVTQLFVTPLEIEPLKEKLLDKSITNCLISSVNPPFESSIQSLFASLNLPFHLLDFTKIKVSLEVDEPEVLGHDRIANVYGALFHFPQNDCIVVDMGTAVTFDYISSRGSYLGGAIYPGVEIGAKALANYTDKLPEVAIQRPEEAIAKTTETHIQSGLYWGLLGAIERITDEMRRSASSPSNVKIIATGGLLRNLSPDAFPQDLSDLVDLIDPALTLIGIHEIMKENQDVR